jgi:lipoprotein NlpI
LAAWVFNKAIESDPKYAYAWNNKGIALYHLKDIKKLSNV